MRTGGKYKGLADLPKAQHIDVRHELARAAGVGGRNVSKVKAILKTAHPTTITALRNGRLSINRAAELSKLGKTQQLAALTQDCCDRLCNMPIRETLQVSTKPLDAAALLGLLQQQEAREPGSVVVKVSKSARTTILIGQDVLTRPQESKPR